MRAMAWAAVPASPTTSMSSTVSSSCPMPRRTISWSSSRNTEMVTGLLRWCRLVARKDGR